MNQVLHFVPLEKICDSCKGNGRKWDDDCINEDCETCFGTGKVATEEGTAILELIANHQKQIIADRKRLLERDAELAAAEMGNVLKW